jgi:hypothetical protein
MARRKLYTRTIKQAHRFSLLLATQYIAISTHTAGDFEKSLVDEERGVVVVDATALRAFLHLSPASGNADSSYLNWVQSMSQ